MNIKNTYTGSKIKNQFTAYLLSFIRGKRRDYLENKIKIDHAEEPIEDYNKFENSISLEELWEAQIREKKLYQEAERKFPDWKELSENQLSKALLALREEERTIIYQHVFEEMSFEKISFINQLSEQRTKGIYYYAIRKIRNMMRGGEDIEF